MGRMEAVRAGWLCLLHKAQGGGGCVAVLVRWLSAPLQGEVEVTQRLYVAHLPSWREEDGATQVGSKQATT
jgi:hypothetical protein